MSKKVLFVGPLHEQSGWGTASRDYVLAMDKVGIDVVCRPIIFQNNYASKLPERIKELEKKSAVGSKVCVQHALPHMYEYNGSFDKNIGMFVTETLGIKHTSWPEHINLMDECWVPNSSMISDIGRYVKPTLKKVVHTFDIAKYKEQNSSNLNKKLDLPGLNGNFTFYFIGEYNRRKNILALIKAFHTEFHPSEPVYLLLKLNKPGCSAEELAQIVDSDCTKMKQALGLYGDISRYKKELILTFNMSDEDILKLHKTCNCFVLPSFGEAWCIPAFEAQAVGTPVVTNDIQGPCEYIFPGRPNGYKVKNRLDSVVGADKMFNDFGTAREQWFSVDIEDLRRNMRLAYNHRHKTVYSPKIEEYSYETVGQTMMELINI